MKPSAERRDPIYVHNLVDPAVEIGIIGTAFLLLFVLRTLWNSNILVFAKLRMVFR